MKQLLKQPLYLLLLASGVFFTSCDDGSEDDETPEIVGPSASASSDSIFINADVTLELNEQEELVMRITGTKGDTTLASIDVTKDGAAAENSTVYFSGLSSSSDTSTSLAVLGGDDRQGFTTDISITLDNSSAGSATYAVKITDDNNNSTELTIIVTLSGAALSAEKTGRIIYNLSGPNAGAFDLDGDSTTASTGVTVSDLQDQGTAVWAGELAPENGAMWVSAELNDYTSATLASITNLYDAGTPGSASQVISVDDVYIVKTSEGAICIVKFTEVNDVADNTDNYVFSYKIAL